MRQTFFFVCSPRQQSDLQLQAQPSRIPSSLWLKIWHQRSASAFDCLLSVFLFFFWIPLFMEVMHLFFGRWLADVTDFNLFSTRWVSNLVFYAQSTIMVISGPVSTWAAIFRLWGSNWRVPYYHCVPTVPMVRLWVLWIFNLGTDVDAHDCTCGLYEHRKTLRESAWKLTLEENSLATLWNWTCVSIVSDLTLDQWSCVPASFFPSFLSCFRFLFIFASLSLFSL